MDDGFSQTQLKQLEQLFDLRLERRFVEERAYYRQLIRDELADVREQLTDIRDRLDRLDKRADEDVKAALKDITVLKKRLAHAEREIVKLKAA